MRRFVPLRSFHTCLIVFAVLVATQGAFSAAPAAVSQTATPSSSVHEIEEFTGVFVADLGTVLFDDTTEHPNGRTLRLKRVRLEPGATPPEEGHSHDGSFVLSVEEGAICYELLSSPPILGTLTARTPQNTSAPAGCAATATDCDDEDGCTLQPGGTVYLPTGSTITQTDTAGHWYRNVDTTNRAVVYLAEDQEGMNAAPCGGGCH